MTIELALEDLVQLTAAAQKNGGVLFITKTTDGDRATITVSADPKKRRKRAEPEAENGGKA
jgi:hypothetical protein